MAIITHPSYKEEKEHLDYTIGYVKQSLSEMTEKKESLENNLDKLKKHYSSDSSQDYIDLMVNTMMQESAELKVKNLKTAQDKPYFCRVDFQENSYNRLEQLYIGKMSLMRSDNQDIVIVDWRAPVANLYYEERLGDAKYMCPGGMIEGKLFLKRQFTIENGELINLFDIDITTNDEFLQAFLGANADNRLKDIVSSIQVEQNRIIRADMWKPLIVQGVAGSGKTTIALHRIAYLIYTFEKTFKPENFMIIAPNTLFLNYISEILPELGVEKVKQTTFENFAQQIIGKKLKITDTDKLFASFIDHEQDINEINKYKNIKKICQIKSSMIFKEIIDKYIESVEQEYIPKTDFRLDTFTLFKDDEINDLFLKQYKRLPIAKRLDEIKKHMENKLKLKQEGLLEYFEKECYRKIDLIKQSMEDSDVRQKLIVEELDKKTARTSKISLQTKQAVKEYMQKISKLDAIEYYKDLFTNDFYERYRNELENSLNREELNFLKSYTKSILDTGNIDIEDVAPISYLKYKIYGVDEKIPAKHVIIDEAQDFSVFQLYVLKNILNCSFTILGDIAQGIHSYRGINDWDKVSEIVFDNKCDFVTLEQSYRTSVEITEAANKVISKLKQANIILSKPVIRHGETPEFIENISLKDIASDIELKIKENQGTFKSVAIICKTMNDCKDFSSLLKDKKLKTSIITGKESEYKGGIVIVPSYLSKGLEFDMVFIVDANNEKYCIDDDIDIKLLYVAMTRALHKLTVYSTGKKAELFA